MKNDADVKAKRNKRSGGGLGGGGGDCLTDKIC